MIAPRDELTGNRRQIVRLSRLFWIVAPSVLLVVILLFAAMSYSGRERTLSDTQKLSESLALLLDDQIERSLQTIALVVQGTQTAYARSGRPGLAGFDEFLRRSDTIRGLVFLNENLIIEDSTSSVQDLGIDLTKEDFIKRLVDDRTLPWSIGTPIERRSFAVFEGSSAQPAFIPLAHAARDAVGNLRSVTIALMNVDALKLQYASLVQDYEAEIRILRFDGMPLIVTRFSA